MSGNRYARARDAFPADPAQRPTSPELAREAIALVAGWGGVGSRSARWMSWETPPTSTAPRLRPGHSTSRCWDRCAWTRALYAPPPPRQPGQKGRPRSGERSAPAVQAQARQTRPGTPSPSPSTAAPSGRWSFAAPPCGTACCRRRAGALCRGARPQWSAQGPRLLLHRPDGQCRLPPGDLRYPVDPGSHLLPPEGPARLRGAEPDGAGRARTAPFAGLVFALIVLWYATELQAGRVATWVARPWYRQQDARRLPTCSPHSVSRASPTPPWPPDRSLAELSPPCSPRRHTNPAAPATPPARAQMRSGIMAELEPSTRRRKSLGGSVGAQPA